MSKASLITDESFGIIPILKKAETYYFLLIQHRQGHWGFPKGHANTGESAIEAACREFTEETGIQNYQVIKDVVFLERYTFSQKGHRISKTVTYFPAFVESEEVKYQESEIQAYMWGSFEATIAHLTYHGSKQVLTEARQYVDAYLLK